MTTLPKGVLVDPVTGNYLYKGVIFSDAASPADIQNIVTSVDNGIPTSYSIIDPVSGNTFTRKVDPASASADSIANYNTIAAAQPGVSAVTATTTQPTSIADTPVNTATNPGGDPSAGGVPYTAADNTSLTTTYPDHSTKTVASDGAVSTTPSPTSTDTAALQQDLYNATNAKDQAQQTAIEAQSAVDFAQSDVTNAQAALDAANATGDPGTISDAANTLQLAQDGLATAQDNANTAQDAATQAGYEADQAQNAVYFAENPSDTVDANGQPIVNPPTDPNNPGSIDASASGASVTDDTTPGGGYYDPATDTRTNLPFGAAAKSPAPAKAQWAEAKDMRVRLRVPPSYLKGPGAGPANILQKTNGILFPYTPQITTSHQAKYNQQTPLHSNFPLYFYQNSTVGPIKINAKFTVQNEFEGAVLLGIIHLLRALTKMKFGNDADAGSPPPVCRFDAFGDYQYHNVPVSVASWTHELPDNVDYIAVGRPGSPGIYGHSMVPVLSTISLDLNIIYSRQEMMDYGVDKWNSGDLKWNGYL